MATTRERGNLIYSLRSRKVSFTPPKSTRASKVPKPQPQPPILQFERTLPPGVSPEFYQRILALEPSIFGPRPPTEKERKRGLKELQDQSRECAATALSFYNKECKKQRKPKYELVNASSSLSNAFCTSEGLFMHAHFEARPKGFPDAPVELFFAELLNDRSLQVTRCCSLGLKDSKFATLGSDGCGRCMGLYHPSDARCMGVHHPRDGRFVGAVAN